MSKVENYDYYDSIGSMGRKLVKDFLVKNGFIIKDEEEALGRIDYEDKRGENYIKLRKSGLLNIIDWKLYETNPLNFLCDVQVKTTKMQGGGLFIKEKDINEYEEINPLIIHVVLEQPHIAFTRRYDLGKVACGFYNDLTEVKRIKEGDFKNSKPSILYSTEKFDIIYPKQDESIIHIVKNKLKGVLVNG